MTGETPAAHEALAVCAPETIETERVPEGYKPSEVGVIPADWEICALQDLGQWKGGATPSMRNPAYWTDGSIPWASSGDIKVVLLEKTHSSITELAVKQTSTSLLPKECIIVVIRSGILRKYLPVAKNMVSLAINQDLKALLPNNDVEADFVLHQLIANGPEILATCQKAGTTVESIEYAWLKSFLIPKPSSKDEQRAIAAALSDVDALISALDNLIAKKRAVKTAAMQQLLTGKQRLPGFSEEWEMKRFGDVAYPRRERVDPKKSSSRTFCIELEHIESGTGRLFGSTSTGDQSSLKAVFQKGDVLFGKLRSYLRKYWLADRSGVCSTEFWVLSANHRLTVPEFLLQVVSMDQFIEAASTAYGTHMPRADWSIVKNYEVPLPSLEEQTAIAGVLSDMDAEIEALEARREKTRQVKRGMMQELLTGRTRLV